MAPVLRAVMLGMHGAKFGSGKNLNSAANEHARTDSAGARHILEEGPGRDQTDMLEHKLYQRASLTRTVR